TRLPEFRSASCIRTRAASIATRKAPAAQVRGRTATPTAGRMQPSRRPRNYRGRATAGTERRVGVDMRSCREYCLAALDADEMKAIGSAIESASWDAFWLCYAPKPSLVRDQRLCALRGLARRRC